MIYEMVEQNKGTLGASIFQGVTRIIASYHFLSSQRKADPIAFLSESLLDGWGYQFGLFRSMTPVGSRYMKLVIRFIEVYFPVRLERWLGCYSRTNSISHNGLMQPVRDFKVLTGVLQLRRT